MYMNKTKFKKIYDTDTIKNYPILMKIPARLDRSNLTSVTENLLHSMV